MSQKNTHKTSKEFELFYNTMSLGWHLRRVMELEPNLISNQEEWDRFVKWLERHKVWTQKKQAKKENIKER